MRGGRRSSLPAQRDNFSSPGTMQTRLEWLTEQLLRIDGVEFHLTVDLDELHSHPSGTNHFLLGKSRAMVDDIVALRENERIRKILDIGIFKGGSAALYTKVFAPEKLVAIEFLPTPVDALTQFIADNDLRDRLVPYYGTDQSDARAMGEILATEFTAKDIDLVVDDASHRYFESRATLNLTLPYLKANGLYVLEDWGWAHWPGDVW